MQQMVSYGRPDVFFEYDWDYTKEDLASQLITRTLEHAFQRKKWCALLQFVKHRRFARTIRDEIADVTYDFSC